MQSQWFCSISRPEAIQFRKELHGLFHRVKSEQSLTTSCSRWSAQVLASVMTNIHLSHVFHRDDLWPPWGNLEQVDCSIHCENQILCNHLLTSIYDLSVPACRERNWILHYQVSLNSHDRPPHLPLLLTSRVRSITCFACQEQIAQTDGHPGPWLVELLPFTFSASNRKATGRGGSPS